MANGDGREQTVADAGSNGATTAGRRRPGARPTAADVARHVGLSRATVSYVLNDTPHQVIPAATRERVLAAAVELGYTPSAAARTLSSGRSDVVLMLLPDWPIGFSVGRSLEFLSSAFAERGFTFVVHPLAAERPIAEVWKAITPAAVLTFEQLDDAERERLTRAGIALGVTLSDERRSGAALVLPEQRTGRLQAEHLAHRGHHRLGYAWPDDERLHGFSRHRLDGVHQACAELRLAEPAVRTIPLDVGAAAEQVQRWADDGVTGICAYNDEVAMAVLAGAHAAGRVVPDDLAVIGADDIPTAALAQPPLTTVVHDQAAAARHIAETLLEQLSDHPEPSQLGSEIFTVVRRASA